MVTSKHTLKYVTRIKYRDMIAGRKNKKNCNKQSIQLQITSILSMGLENVIHDT
jgi:uncharacterized membrane protein